MYSIHFVIYYKVRKNNGFNDNLNQHTAIYINFHQSIICSITSVLDIKIVESAVCNTELRKF